jgi:hypothetical protein
MPAAPIQLHALVLSQISPPRQWTLQDSINLVILIALIIVGLLILGVVLITARRRLLSKDVQTVMGSAGSLLDELRRMRNRGQITAEEYDAARLAATSRVAGGKPGPPGTERQAPTGAKVAPRSPAAGEVVAPPGFDLTGAPLPKRPGADSPA